jgi:hypothetical protein
MTYQINSDRYNALVRAFSRANEALTSDPSVEDFTTSIQWEMYSKIDALGEKENFSLKPFLDDAYAFSHGFTGPFYPCRHGEVRLAPVLPPILIELVRAFKNRSPSLGERFERVVKTNDSVATKTIEFLIAEYLYLDRSASCVTREAKNEAFRLAMFDAHAEPLYIAALNVIRSYATSMARAVLAADVGSAIGGENNAD